MKVELKKMLKKGQSGVGGIFYAAAAAALAFVVTGLIISYGAKVNSDTSALYNTNASAGSISAALAAGNTTLGISTFATNLPTMASVGVAVLIIGLLIYGFSGLFKGSGEM